MEHFFYLSSSYLFCFQIQMTMASSFIRILFCVANIAHFLYVIYFRWGIRMEGDRYNTFGDETPLLHFASKFLPFLTYWNVLLQLFYFCVCLLDAIVGSKDKSKAKTPTSPLQRFRDFLFRRWHFLFRFWWQQVFGQFMELTENLFGHRFLTKFTPYGSITWSTPHACSVKLLKWQWYSMFFQQTKREWRLLLDSTLHIWHGYSILPSTKEFGFTQFFKNCRQSVGRSLSLCLE